MVVCGENGMLTADYVRRTVRVEVSATRDIQTRDIHGFQITRETEPLRLEIQDFIRQVTNNRIAPVSGEDGILALRTALAMVDSSQWAKVIQL